MTFHSILDLLRQNNTFAISTHLRPDGDAIGSALALYTFLQRQNKIVRIFNTDPTPQNYKFLPNIDQIENESAIGDFQPEILIVLDASTLERIGEKLSKKLTPKNAIVNIDHHSFAENFGDHNLIDPNASSTCEIIYRIIVESGAEIDHDLALQLYTGIMFDTGCFRYSNATTTVHRIAADLISKGIQVADVYQNVYENLSIRKLHLLGALLKTIELSDDGQIAWTTITQDILRSTSATLDDTEGFINYARSIDGVDTAIVITEDSDGNSKISMRSKGKIDVGKICFDLGGGGHAKAAGADSDLPPEIALQNAIELVKNEIAKS